MNTNKENENLSRREIRRKRRIRNQVLAYVSLIGIAILLIVGISYGGKMATEYFVNKEKEELEEDKKLKRNKGKITN